MLKCLQDCYCVHADEHLQQRQLDLSLVIHQYSCMLQQMHVDNAMGSRERQADSQLYVHEASLIYETKMQPCPYLLNGNAEGLGAIAEPWCQRLNFHFLSAESLYFH